MATKPKIIVFSTAYHPFIGGAEIAIHEVAKRLSNRFDFLILTSRFRRNLPKKEIRPEGTVIRFGFGTPLDKFLLIPFSFVYVVWNLIFGIWKFPKQNSKRILLWGMDIGQGSLTASLIKLFFPRIPFILTLQYGQSEEYLGRGRFGAINFSFKFMLRRANFVTVISTYLLDLVRRYGYTESGEVIPNGVDINKFKDKSKKLKIADANKKIIITTSRLVPKNGIDTLIKAVAEVKKEFPEIRCHIIGDGPDRRNLELQTTNYKLQANVKFFGSIPHEKIPAYLKAADVFVRPSRSEGMGNSFVEALAAGLPIIGTPMGGIVDIIEDPSTGLGQATGFFAKPDDAEDLARKIIYVLHHTEDAKRTVEAGRKMVEERFSWDSISSAYSLIFENVRTSPRLLIATPLYPPQLGGPALYAKNLGDKFRVSGMRVSVVSFGDVLSLLALARHFVYFLKFTRRCFSADVIFCLDSFSVGLPAALAAALFRIPFVLRVEGDFLWESFMERTRGEVTLPNFYANFQALTRKERIIRAAIGWVMRRADRLVFSSKWRREMIIQAFGVDRQKIVIIRNVWPSANTLPVTGYQLPVKKVVLWAGRMLYLKNLYRLIRAFSAANAGEYELKLIGNGPEKNQVEKFVKENGFPGITFAPPARHDDILREMSEASFLVLPSFSDVGPNVIAEAYSRGTPFLFTKNSGYTEYIADNSFWVDPLNDEELVPKLKWLMDEKNRAAQKEKLRKMHIVHSWEDAAQEWMNIFKEIVK